MFHWSKELSQWLDVMLPPSCLISSLMFSPSGWRSGHSGCSWTRRRSAWLHSWCRNPRPAAGYRRGRRRTPGRRSRTGSIWYWGEVQEEVSRGVSSVGVKQWHRPKCHSQRGQDHVVLSVAGKVSLDEDFGLGQRFVPAATKQRRAGIAQQGGHQGGVGHCPNAPDTAIITTWGGIIYQHTGGTHRTYNHTTHQCHRGRKKKRVGQGWGGWGQWGTRWKRPHSVCKSMNTCAPPTTTTTRQESNKKKGAREELEQQEWRTRV